MIFETIPIRTEGSAPDTKLNLYLWDYTPRIPIEKRPFILILPGGGYDHTSDREAEAVALRLMAMGYHTGVLRYSCMPVRFPVSLRETAEAVCHVREIASQRHIDAEKILVMGFSAGGHLAASYGVLYKNEEIFAGIGDEGSRSVQGLILCYPVIVSSGPQCHEGSIKALLGERAGDAEYLDLASPLNHVAADTPPTFIWNTSEDETVPPANSLMWAMALTQKGVPVELHMYRRGVHGISLANEQTAEADGSRKQKECENWPELLKAWLESSGFTCT